MIDNAVSALAKILLYDNELPAEMRVAHLRRVVLSLPLDADHVEDGPVAECLHNAVNLHRDDSPNIPTAELGELLPQLHQALLAMRDDQATSPEAVPLLVRPARLNACAQPES